MAEHLYIVCEKDDGFAIAFGQYLAKKERAFQTCSAEEFSRQVTIVHDEGKIVVTPEASLLIRPVRGLTYNSDEEVRFVWSENFAAIWSAAALTPFPVVNRPNEWGWGGRTALSASVTQLRMNEAVIGQEYFWHKNSPTREQGMYHQDLMNWQIIHEPDVSSHWRSRQLPLCRGWEQVIVVGDQGCRVTDADIGQLALEERSVVCTRQLGLEFATVSWGIGDDEAFVSRVNPFPALWECLPVWDQVCYQLTQLLFT